MNDSFMSTTATVRRSRQARSIRRCLAIMICVLMIIPFAGRATAQDPQPTQDPAQLAPSDPTAPQPTEDEDAAPTEPADEQVAPEATPAPGEEDGEGTRNTNRVTRAAQRADDAAGPGFPAVLAHGLAYVAGDDLVWQVRDTEMPSVDNAESTTSNAAILLQRDGSSIIRNDVTGKRAKTDPGEAYFRAAGDGYTVMAEGDESIVWTFELVDPDDVAIDAFYESPLIKDLEEGVYDMSLTRYVLTPGEKLDLPRHGGAGLVMVSSGEIEVSAEGERSVLAPSDGQTIADEASVANTSDESAVFVYAYLGDEVGDGTAGAPQAEAGTSTDESGEPIDETGDTAPETDTLEEEAETDSGTAEEGTAPTAEESGNFLTSIDVTADIDIYLIITVDGTTVFDGTLPAGASSGPVVGTTFEVYTSSGVNTNFTNACGDYFKMGYEEGEATYYLEATESSCAP